MLEFQRRRGLGQRDDGGERNLSSRRGGRRQINAVERTAHVVEIAHVGAEDYAILVRLGEIG